MKTPSGPSAAGSASIQATSAKQAGRRLKYQNRHYGFTVMTSQETDLFLNPVSSVETDGENGYRVTYEDA